MKLGHKSRKVGGRQTRKTRSWFKLPKHYSRLHKLISYLFDSLLENSNLVKVIKKGCFSFLFFSSIGIASWNHVSNGMRRVVRRNGKVWWYCKCMEPEKMRRGTSAIAGSKARREKERERRGNKHLSECSWSPFKKKCRTTPLPTIIKDHSWKCVHFTIMGKEGTPKSLQE